MDYLKFDWNKPNVIIFIFFLMSIREEALFHDILTEMTAILYLEIPSEVILSPNLDGGRFLYGFCKRLFDLIKVFIYVEVLYWI